jgi:hypothetical protein
MVYSEIDTGQFSVEVACFGRAESAGGVERKPDAESRGLVSKQCALDNSKGILPILSSLFIFLKLIYIATLK